MVPGVCCAGLMVPGVCCAGLMVPGACCAGLMVPMMCWPHGARCLLCWHLLRWMKSSDTEDHPNFAISLHLRDLFSVSCPVSATSVHVLRPAFCPQRSAPQRISAPRSAPQRPSAPALRVPRPSAPRPSTQRQAPSTQRPPGVVVPRSAVYDGDNQTNRGIHTAPCAQGVLSASVPYSGGLL